MLHYDRTDKPYLTEHSGHCSCCDARFAADADLYMVPADDYAARSDMRATVPVCAQCLTPEQHERTRDRAHHHVPRVRTLHDPVRGEPSQAHLLDQLHAAGMASQAGWLTFRSWCQPVLEC